MSISIGDMCEGLRDLRYWVRNHPGEILYLGNEFYCKGVYGESLLICSARSAKDAERFFKEVEAAHER